MNAREAREISTLNRKVFVDNQIKEINCKIKKLCNEGVFGFNQGHDIYPEVEEDLISRGFKVFDNCLISW